MAFYCLTMDMQMTRMMNKWRLSASFFLLFSSLLSAEEPAAAPSVQFSAFEASYNVLRSGKKHGEAKRYLKSTEQGYELGYSSDISWLILEDKRSEQSFFTVKEGRIQPTRYVMQRTGSGPNRYYELNLNWDSKELRVEKSKKIKTIRNDFMTLSFKLLIKSGTVRIKSILSDVSLTLKTLAIIISLK